MPIYLYRHPKTKKIVEVIQRMIEPHVYSENGVEFIRVFTIPQGATDTRIDPNSSRDFSEKMGRKKCKLGDMYDEAAELSQKREKQMGKDPVKEKYLEQYSKKRKGRRHPSTTKDPALILGL